MNSTSNTSHPQQHTLSRIGQSLAVLAATAMVAACASNPAPSSPSAVSPPTASHAAPPVQSPNLATALPAYYWDLTAALDARGQPVPGYLLPGHPAPRLQFLDRTLSVQNLCNGINAGYTLTGERLEVGRGMATMRACSDQALIARDQRVGAQLPLAQRVAMQSGPSPRLTVHFSDGSRWELVGTPTPATRYGSAGERMFLEVAPDRVACNHPLMRNAQCLRVRDVHFAENGVKLRTGEWRIFQGEIEGYQHERGIRNVVRVNRYPLARPGQPAPADAPSHAYVLDMVVESERVR